MFNEKKLEKICDKETKKFKEVEVWQTPKYIESRKKAIELIEKEGYGLTEGDFWILMNETKSGTMNYTGLIISHNGCLKINDKLSKEEKFNPACLTRSNCDDGSIIYEYNNPEQMLYEVGEVSSKNCKNEYPYAMAFKRCFDRVVLKITKLAYAGIYSEVEADEFKKDLADSYEALEQRAKELNVDFEKAKAYYKTDKLSKENLKNAIEIKENAVVNPKSFGGENNG